MGVQYQVTFNQLWPSDEVMELVQQGTEKLESDYGRVENCHVVVERTRNRKGKGRKFRVVVNVETGADDADDATATSEHSRLRTALTNAFHSVGPKVAASSRARRSNRPLRAIPAGPQRDAA